jgi:MFS family permease
MSSATCDQVPVPTIWSRQLVLLLTAESGLLTAFYLLASVVPLYAAANGGGQRAAGLATGTLMLSTVVTDLAVARLLARYGYRAALIAGAALLGLPMISLIASSGLPLILAVCLIRGVGLGLVVVAGPALAAELVPDDRRGEGIGLYGVAVGLPSVVGLPLGVWLARHAGFHVVFAAGAIVALAAMGPALALPARQRRARQRRASRGRTRQEGGRQARHASVFSGLLRGGLVRPSLVFAATTLGAGVIMTFVPLAMSAWSASIALLAYSGAAPVARWVAGRYGDRRGTGRLLVPVMLVTAAGSAGLLAVHSPASVIIGMAVYGAGFGAAQNLTLTVMLDRAPRDEYGKVSAVWNVAYDGGMGVGAVGFGLVAGVTGYRTGFALVTCLLLIALIPAWLDQNRGRA